MILRSTVKAVSKNSTPFVNYKPWNRQVISVAPILKILQNNSEKFQKIMKNLKY